VSPTTLHDLSCRDEDARRQALSLRADLEGIDYLEVRTAGTQNQRVLDVHFIAKEPASTGPLHDLLDALAAAATHIRITGGERQRNIRVVSAARDGDVLVVTVDRPGDFSTYTLQLGDPGVAGVPRLDPAFAGVTFSFKAGCPSRFDCRGDCRCDDEELPETDVDYMAKDFRSFRQALLDRLPTLAPGWLERHEADLGVTLVELLAYAGDQLSYQQDAIANEAYLQTARQRVSARRHARLVDYRIDEGASARAFVVAQVRGGAVLPAGSQLLTTLHVPFATQQPPLPAVLDPPAGSDKERHRERARERAIVFETVADAILDPKLGTIAIHTWSLGDCCLPRGATTIDLQGDLASVPGGAGWRLRPGRLLVLEETVGAATGLAADADVTHRQVVRLTDAATVEDPLSPTPVTRVRWDDADALTFPLCVNRRDDEDVVHPVAIACGNVLVADHGESRTQNWPQTPAWWATSAPPVPPRGLVRGRRTTRVLLDEGPPSAWRPPGDGPVAQMLDAPTTLQIRLAVERSQTDTLPYELADDLIGARPFDTRFVAEVMNDGRASLRFGDGTHGLPPTEGAFVHVDYRVGRGREGNVGAEAISHLLVGEGQTAPPITALRNPLPAAGGTDPETLAQIKIRAPAAFRSPQLRAVTAADYAEVARRHPAVAGAVARFRWTGSWLTVFLTIDPHDRQRLDAGLADELKTFVAAYTQTGYDLEVRPPRYVPLDLELFVCVTGDRFRADVERALLEELSSRRLAHGRLSFFHPDRFGFGQPLYLSALYAATAAVPGVDSVVARRFSGYYDADPRPSRPLTKANVGAGVIAVGDLEVLELANDPSLPERGVLKIATGGGR
jgi:hypothetical protein